MRINLRKIVISGLAQAQIQAFRWKLLKTPYRLFCVDITIGWRSTLPRWPLTTPRSTSVGRHPNIKPRLVKSRIRVRTGSAATSLCTPFSRLCLQPRWTPGTWTLGASRRHSVRYRLTARHLILMAFFTFKFLLICFNTFKLWKLFSRSAKAFLWL